MYYRQSIHLGIQADADRLKSTRIAETLLDLLP